MSRSNRLFLGFLLLLAYLSDLAASYQMLPALGKDFVMGFEQGVYLKKDAKRMEDEFGCPQPRAQYSKFSYLHDILDQIAEISERISLT